MNTIEGVGLDCVGCRSCEQSCPKKCITMKENQEGFLYPVIEQENCVNCGVCLSKCPMNKYSFEKRKPIETYALKSKDNDSILRSASGGASDLVVKAILEQHGYVYGAAYDEKLKVNHIEVTNEEGRKRIQSSKYVQSDLNNTYTKAQERLKEGKLVLFTGTPCQIAGLYSFLGKEYENLYTIDLICHGVPSPKFFKKYLNYLSKKLNGEIRYFNFRSKEKRGWGTQYLVKTDTRKKTNKLILDKYGKHFMDGDCYRESCYRCRYANIHRPADLTVGDFWGVEQCYPEFSSSLGVSSVMVNSENGKKLIEYMKNNADIISVELHDILIKQHNLKKHTVRPSSRDDFYREIENTNFIDKIKIGFQIKEVIKSFIPRRVYVKLKKYIR